MSRAWKRAIAAGLCLAAPWLPSKAMAEPGLEGSLRSATECTDGMVQLYTSRSCDPPTQIAALAVQACQEKWRALAANAVKAPPNDATRDDVEAYHKRLRDYADGMEHEYTKIAELKAIDIREGSDSCSSDQER